ncbi:MAG: UDP-N-acetylmuramoyl-L-alanine--D-glutamate ligase, partial [Actinomycetia bacterium]|nr:UDP-N-acetylmuramoyl-L-alanine--D-glutamate ligase [Actinomycetes bacterium]
QQRLLPASELLIKGRHNAINALAAAAIAWSLGVTSEAICAGLRSFKPLEHRIEDVGQLAGVNYCNDSKATNPEATLMALTAFSSGTIILLLGGDDKLTNLDELVAQALRDCRQIICYGQAGERFYNALTAGNASVAGQLAAVDSASVSSTASLAAGQVRRAAGLRDAFQMAVGAARPGDTVLLSPACASFDEFNSFEERGRVFKQLVADLAAQQGR